jgi:hypothetical protein
MITNHFFKQIGIVLMPYVAGLHFPVGLELQGALTPRRYQMPEKP